MSYKVCIPTAGIGSRLDKKTKFINKSLVSLNNRPIISHIIDKFPSDCEFIIPLGYKASLVRDFLEITYPKHNFRFKEIHPYIGSNSGLGHTLTVCKEFLKDPFIFISCDTIVLENIPPPNENWMGFNNNIFSDQYRTIELINNYVSKINDKKIGKKNIDFPYIGLCGVKNYELFWDAMTVGNSDMINSGEIFGLKSLIQKRIKAINFSWFDMGNTKSLEFARKSLIDRNQPNILEKENEAVWFANGKVIKFSDDHNFISNRIKRSELLSEFTPKIIDKRENMYSYQFINGKTLSKIINIPLFEEFLNFQKYFWFTFPIENKLNKKDFTSNCKKFYKDKTISRVKNFKNIYQLPENLIINNEKFPDIFELLDNIDWEYISEGVQVRFHGDLHFENIIYSDIEKKFTILDWRQNFCNELFIGDIYYDLAKLLHGMIISHELISQNRFKVEIKNNMIFFDFEKKYILCECEKYFSDWIIKNNFDLKKTYIHTALIFLNIAPLHEDPYSKLLYCLGKKMLFKHLN